MSLDVRIGVIGLGYVGLPVAISLARKFPVIGYDVDPRRISSLRECVDWTGEIEPAELQRSTLLFAEATADLADCNFFVIAVPTPFARDGQHTPDVSYVMDAARAVERARDLRLLALDTDPQWASAALSALLVAAVRLSGRQQMDAAAVAPSTTAVLSNLGNSTKLAFTVEPGTGSTTPTGALIAELPLT